MNSVSADRGTNRVDNTAQLPISGMVLTGTAVMEQWLLLVGCLVLVAVMMALVRVGWRRGKRVADV
jgi:hypothetical protein